MTGELKPTPRRSTVLLAGGRDLVEEEIDGAFVRRGVVEGNGHLAALHALGDLFKGVLPPLAVTPGELLLVEACQIGPATVSDHSWHSRSHQGERYSAADYAAYVHGNLPRTCPFASR